MSKELYANKPLQDEYRSHFGSGCEVWQHLSGEAQLKCVQLGSRRIRKLDTHHIFHNIGRIDEWSNLITVNHVVHLAWGHGQNPIEFTICCLYAKWWKSQQEASVLNPYPQDEFNLKELRYCAGQSVLGWLEWKGMANVSRDSDYYRMCLEMREMN